MFDTLSLAVELHSGFGTVTGHGSRSYRKKTIKREEREEIKKRKEMGERISLRKNLNKK